MPAGHGTPALGLTLSLGIELLQAALPARVSSATDLVTNLLGTAIGAWLALAGPVARRLEARAAAVSGR